MADVPLPAPTGEPIVIVELDKSGNIQRKWLHRPDNVVVPIPIYSRSPNARFTHSLAAWRKTLVDAFLPVGFPHSVTPDYLAYQTYDSLQAFFSTITGLLANRALLQGLGVGDASSSATFALLLTIIKDATSRIATIVFAHRFGLSIEPDAKRYRFLADLFNDSAFFLELASPFLGPGAKVCVLGIGEALRAICGVAAGASKAALSAHFAKFENLAELNAKEASQETAIGLMGLLVGTLVVKMVESPQAVFCLMIVLVLGHLWMNYLGVRSVVMNTLNRQRATIVYQEFLRTGRVLTPIGVSQREAILFWSPLIQNSAGEPAAAITMASDYRDSVESNTLDYEQMANVGSNPCFIVCILERPSRIKIMLMEGATPRDAVGAWFTAVGIAWETGRMTQNEKGTPPQAIWKQKGLCDALVEHGWSLDTQWLETGAPFRLQVVDKEE